MDLEKRIEELEKKLRRHRRLSIVVVCCLVFAWGMWEKFYVPKTIVAEKFSIVNGVGKVLSSWGIIEDGPIFMMQDEYEKRRLTLGFGEEGEYFGLFVSDAEDNKNRLFVGTSEESTKKKTASVLLADEDGKTRLNLTVEKGKPSFWMGDRDDKRTVALAILEKGSGLHVNDGKGQRRLFAGTDRNESTGRERPLISLEDEKSVPKGQWRLTPKGPNLTMWGPSQKRTLGFGLTEKGAGLVVNDAKGQSRLFAGTTRVESTGEESPTTTLQDEMGNTRASFYYQKKEGSFLTFMDSKKIHRAGLGLDNNSEPGIWFANEKDKVFWSVPPHEK